MIVNQLSAFVENKAGRLAEIAETLAANNIDLSAVSLADSADYGIMRMLVSNPDEAAKVLRESGVICKIPCGFCRSLFLCDAATSPCQCVTGMPDSRSKSSMR